MKLLLDENPPERLKPDPVPHQAFTVRDMGWHGKSNGELLRLMKEAGFEALITFDRDLAYQQNLKAYDLPVIVLDAADNTYPTLAPMVPAIKQAIEQGLGMGPNPIR